LKSGKIKFQSFKLNDVKVQLFGDTAVVFGHTTERLMVDGKQIDGDNRFTDTFIKRNGKWICVATHVTAIPPPGPQKK
jgi:ketosteroid isomerase-like protein